MRLLYVTHLYPPDHTAGVEVFASTTAKELAARGHELRVVTTRKDIARRDLSVVEVSPDEPGQSPGVSVMEITNNLFAKDFEETYQRPGIDRIVAEELDRFRPDAVHVHHLLYLSAGILAECKSRQIPVVMTLHDFWIGCARFGQLLHADGSRCVAVDPSRCATCLPSLQWKQSDGARRLAKAVGAVAESIGLDLKGPLIAARKRLDGLQGGGDVPAPAAPGGEGPPGRAGTQGPGPGAGDWIPPGPAEVESFYGASRARLGALVEAVNSSVDRIVLPAEFMVSWFTELGLDPERMVVETTGVDWAGAAAEPRVLRAPGAPVRVLFLGSLVPHKGAHVLLEAWGQLDDSVRDQATLSMHGPDRHRPAYVAALRYRAEALGVTIGGRLDREQVRQEFARTDVLVVPSLWLEIRPLVILEAYAAGARVIATDLGGMREVMGDGVPGRTFPEGNVGALCQSLIAEIEAHVSGAVDPEPVRAPSSLFRGWPEVATSLEGLYGALVHGKGADSAGA